VGNQAVRAAKDAPPYAGQCGQRLAMRAAKDALTYTHGVGGGTCRRHASICCDAAKAGDGRMNTREEDRGRHGRNGESESRHGGEAEYAPSWVCSNYGAPIIV
jgi:hypothetical protein